MKTISVHLTFSVPDDEFIRENDRVIVNKDSYIGFLKNLSTKSFKVSTKDETTKMAIQERLTT